jgi:hypothetical protein
VEVSAPRHLPSIALSPALWPDIIAGFIVVISAVLAVQSWYKKRESRSHHRTNEGDTSGPISLLGANVVKTIIAALLLIPYYIACGRFGLLLPSIVALSVFALLAGERGYVVTLVCAIALPFALTWFFLHVAGVVIPLGPLTGML